MQLITRLDFDGVVCAAMISEMETIHEIEFSNPKDVEDRMVEIDFGDALVHLPFHPDASIWFQNREPSNIAESLLKNVRGKFENAPSTARLVLDYYKSPNLARYEKIVNEVDRIQSADLTRDDIMSPKGWVMLSYTLDPRFMQEREYGVYLIELIREGKTVNDILAKEPVAKRVKRYLGDEEKYSQVLGTHTKVQGNVIITDFRDLTDQPHGNRFFVFTKFPDANVHIRLDQLDRMRVKASVSKSIINNTCKVDIGNLMEEFGGGGVAGAGACLLGTRTADTRIAQIVDKLKS